MTRLPDDYRDMYPKPFLDHRDLQGKAHLMTIKSVASQELHNSKTNQKELKWILHFERARKYLILNQTMAEAVAKATGENNPHNWAGKVVEIYPTQVDAFGQTHDVVRVRKAKPPVAAPKPDEPAEKSAPAREKVEEPAGPPGSPDASSGAPARSWTDEQVAVVLNAALMKEPAEARAFLDQSPLPETASKFEIDRFTRDFASLHYDLGMSTTEALAKAVDAWKAENLSPQAAREGENA